MYATELAVGIVFTKGALLRRVEAILSERSDQLRRLSAASGVAVAVACSSSFVVALAVPVGFGAAGLEMHAPGMVQRHLWSGGGEVSLLGGVSADGGALSYVDWTAGNIGVRDMATGEQRLVTANASWEGIDGWGESSAISADGRRVAYAWCRETGFPHYELHVVDADGANHRVLVDDEGVFWIRPLAWSPDGADILAYFSGAERDQVDERTGNRHRLGRLVLVAASNGSVAIIHTMADGGFPQKGAFSPDGRWVAFDVPEDGAGGPRDVVLVDLANGNALTPILHPADDRLVGWTPDGNRLLFASDRTPSRSLWGMTVSPGGGLSRPEVVLASFEGESQGLTGDGDLYYGMIRELVDVALAEADLGDPGYAGELRLVSPRRTGSTGWPDWSQDGSRLAYIAFPQGFGGGEWAVAVFTPAEGTERLLSPSPGFRGGRNRVTGGPRWSPDGRFLALEADGVEGGRGIYTIDVETGSTSLAARDVGGQPVWSPEGDAIYSSNRSQVLRTDLRTGTTTVVCGGEGAYIPAFDLSPDGERIACWMGGLTIAILSARGGEAREVLRLGQGEGVAGPWICWTPDGSGLLFPKERAQTWVLGADSGVQRKLADLDIPGSVHAAAVHPAGSPIAFTIAESRFSLWVMEDFLASAP